MVAGLSGSGKPPAGHRLRAVYRRRSGHETEAISTKAEPRVPATSVVFAFFVL
jgi:hypothetical protein